MRFMVIGASGYLGNTVYKKLKNSYDNDVYGTCYKTGTYMEYWNRYSNHFIEHQV